MNPPKPTALKLIDGNPGKRPVNKNEPKPRPVAPTCPSWMTARAKAEWRRVSPQLEELGLLTQIDRVALAGYCQSYADYVDAKEFIKKKGPVYAIKNEDGTVKYLQQVPQVAIAHKSLLVIKAFCQEFGMTPSARSRMSVAGADDGDDDMESLLSGG